MSLTWSAATAPGAEVVKYYVTRDGEDPGGTCAAPAVPTAATSCVDSGLSIAKHTYTVTAVWRSWSRTSGTSSATITVGAATQFTIAAATTTPAVSAADNLTITAKDEKGSTVTTYTGSHTLVFSGASSSSSGAAPTVANASGTAIAFGANTALTFTAGVASVASSKNGVLKIYKSGAANIAASEGSITTPAPLALTVSPGAATKFTLAVQTATPAVGAPNDLTITAQDAYGNTATSYTGSKNIVFAGPAASPSPSSKAATVSDSAGNDIPIGTATPIVFSAGVAAATGENNGELVVYKSGPTTIKATEGSITHTAVALTVAAGSANKLLLTAATTTPVAAAADSLTLTARDAYENTATAYTGSKNIVFSGAEASPSGAAPTVANASGTAISFGATTALTFSSGIATVSSTKNGVLKLNKAGAASVSATDGTLTTAPLAFTVSIGPAARIGLTSVAVSTGTIGSPCLFTCTITALGNSGTVTANLSVTDSVGNTVSELGSGHTAKVTATAGGSVAGGTELTFPATGAAVSPTQFTYTSPASGAFSNHTITAATLAGTVYTSATATVSK